MFQLDPTFTYIHILNFRDSFQLGMYAFCNTYGKPKRQMQPYLHPTCAWDCKKSFQTETALEYLKCFIIETTMEHNTTAQEL